MSDPRESLQKEAKEKWLASERKNSIILPTGSGKSKVAIDIIKEQDPLKILLLTNSEELRDNTWKKEFEKFGAMGYWENTESQCYQTMCNRTGEWDFIIMDEIDFCVGTPEYGKCLSEERLKSKAVLGLTGFITKEKEEILNSYYPICYTANIEDLQDQNILNQSEFILVEFPLSLQKTIKQQTKKGQTFYSSENDLYKYWDKQFKLANIQRSQIEKKHRILTQSFEDKKDWQAIDWKYKISAAKRKKVLHTLDTTTKVVNNLVEHIHKVDGNKILIFSTLTTECDKLPNPYHGKSDEDIKGIERLNSGEINTLAVVKKITRGVNMIGVNHLIRATYDGSESDFFQTHGRGMRLEVGQVFKYIILLPVYQDLVKVLDGSFRLQVLYTQAERWQDKMMQSLQRPNIKIIRLDKTLMIKSEINI